MKKYGMRIAALVLTQVFIFTTLLSASPLKEPSLYRDHLRTQSTVASDGGRELLKAMGVSVKDGASRVAQIEGVRYTHPERVARYSDVVTPEILEATITIDRAVRRERRQRISAQEERLGWIRSGDHTIRFRDPAEELTDAVTEEWTVEKIRTERWDGAIPEKAVAISKQANSTEELWRLLDEAGLGKWKKVLSPWHQMTGPADSPRKLVYGMNGVKGGRAPRGYMIDLEDSMNLRRVLESLRNIRKAVNEDEEFVSLEREMGYTHDVSKWPHIIIRPSGLHLDNPELLVDGQGVSASVFDVVASLTPIVKALIERHNQDPYLYLPKINTFEDAVLWDEILMMIEERLGLDPGTIKVEVLVERIYATAELEEIVWALRRRIVAINAGRYDYANSWIEAMSGQKDTVAPDWKSMTMDKAFLRNYVERIGRIAAKHNILFIGGMAQQIPEKDEEANRDAMARVKKDKLTYEIPFGASGAWMAHPGMANTLEETFAGGLEGRPNQLGRENLGPVEYTDKALQGLIVAHEGTRTEAGARYNVNTILQFIASYFGPEGSAAVAVYDTNQRLRLMQDRATAETLFRLLHELLHKPNAVLENGERLPPKRLAQLISEELKNVQVGKDNAVKSKYYPVAAKILQRAVLNEKLIPWLTDLLHLVDGITDDPDALDAAIETYLETYNKTGTRLTRPDLGEAFREKGAIRKEARKIKQWWALQRRQGRHITRLHSAEAIAALRIQRGPRQSFPVQNEVANKAYRRLREHQANKTAINTFGPFDEASIEQMAREGVEGIYIGGWAESARHGTADLARYPLGYVSKTVARYSRILQQHARIQGVDRSRMTVEKLTDTPEIDFFLPLMVDIDETHGAPEEITEVTMTEADGNNPPLVFAMHAEDQAVKCKKCGHMSGKVLVSTGEHIKRLNQIRAKLDVMGLDTLIVARTDAESAEFITSDLDVRDHPFLLGATKLLNPYHEVIQKAREDGLPEAEVEKVHKWWKKEAGLMTLGEAVARAIEEAQPSVRLKMSADKWRAFAKNASIKEMKAKAESLGIHVYTVEEWQLLQKHKPEVLEGGINILWDHNLPRTEEQGYTYWMIRSGLDMAIARSKAFLPHADISWMEQHHPSVEEVKEWADALIAHAKVLKMPQPLLANNTSPSFYWRAKDKGKVLSNEELQTFLTRQAEAGIQFNFITYAGAELNHYGITRFMKDFRARGMLAWADFQDEAIKAGDAFVSDSQGWAGVRWKEAELAAGRGGKLVASATGERDTMQQFAQAKEKTAKDGASRNSQITPKELSRVLRDIAAQRGNGMEVKIRPEESVWIYPTVADAHRADVLNGIRQLQQAGVKFEENPSFTSIARTGKAGGFKIDDRDALHLVAVGDYYGFWKVFPNPDDSRAAVLFRHDKGKKDFPSVDGKVLNLPAEEAKDGAEREWFPTVATLFAKRWHLPTVGGDLEFVVPAPFLVPDREKDQVQMAEALETIFEANRGSRILTTGPVSIRNLAYSKTILAIDGSLLENELTQKEFMIVLELLKRSGREAPIWLVDTNPGKKLPYREALQSMAELYRDFVSFKEFDAYRSEVVQHRYGKLPFVRIALSTNADKMELPQVVVDSPKEGETVSAFSFMSLALGKDPALAKVMEPLQALLNTIKAQLVITPTAAYQKAVEFAYRQL